MATGAAALADLRNIPYALGGVSLTVGARPAALYYVSPTQVNARIDAGLAAGAAAVVLTSTTGTYTATVTVAPSAPGLFSLN